MAWLFEKAQCSEDKNTLKHKAPKDQSKRPQLTPKYIFICIFKFDHSEINKRWFSIITLFDYFICMSKNVIIIYKFQNSTSLSKSHIVVTSQSMKKKFGAY